jgi:hypothetical protein
LNKNKTNLILGANVNRTTEEAQETACKYLSKNTIPLILGINIFSNIGMCWWIFGCSQNSSI